MQSREKEPCMRTIVANLSLAIVLLAGACPAPRPPDAGDLLAERADQTTLEMVRAVGDRAAL
ncbi:MAG: hypothetical protein DRI34_11750, partial [Deltaproteobacteria bacterium]